MTFLYYICVSNSIFIYNEEEFAERRVPRGIWISNEQPSAVRSRRTSTRTVYLYSVCHLRIASLAIRSDLRITFKRGGETPRGNEIDRLTTATAANYRNLGVFLAVGASPRRIAAGCIITRAPITADCPRVFFAADRARRVMRQVTGAEKSLRTRRVCAS